MVDRALKKARFVKTEEEECLLLLLRVAAWFCFIGQRKKMEERMEGARKPTTAWRGNAFMACAAGMKRNDWDHSARACLG
jgi:hypothetical protein